MAQKNKAAKRASIPATKSRKKTTSKNLGGATAAKKAAASNVEKPLKKGGGSGGKSTPHAKPPAVKKAVTKKPAAKKHDPKKNVPGSPDGLPEKFRDAALKVLDERQAEEIVTIDLRGKSAIADYVIIASGRNARQVSAIAGYLREAFFGLGLKNTRIEGQQEGNWVLVDGGDVIVHLFRPEVRSYYNLETLWDGSGGDDQFKKIAHRDNNLP